MLVFSLGVVKEVVNALMNTANTVLNVDFKAFIGCLMLLSIETPRLHKM